MEIQSKKNKIKMPRTTDPELIEAQKEIRDNIRKDFAKWIDDGYRYEVAMKKVKRKYAKSESTIGQIINRYGNYAD